MQWVAPHLFRLLLLLLVAVCDFPLYENDYSLGEQRQHYLDSRPKPSPKRRSQ